MHILWDRYMRATAKSELTCTNPSKKEDKIPQWHSDTLWWHTWTSCRVLRTHILVMVLQGLTIFTRMNVLLYIKSTTWNVKNINILWLELHVWLRFELLRPWTYFQAVSPWTLCSGGREGPKEDLCEYFDRIFWPYLYEECFLNVEGLFCLFCQFPE